MITFFFWFLPYQLFVAGVMRQLENPRIVSYFPQFLVFMAETIGRPLYGRLRHSPDLWCLNSWSFEELASPIGHSNDTVPEDWLLPGLWNKRLEGIAIYLQPIRIISFDIYCNLHEKMVNWWLDRAAKGCSLTARKIHKYWTEWNKNQHFYEQKGLHR